MNVYFDACSLNRTLDDRSQARVAVEAEAMLNLFTLIEPGTLRLISSSVLQLEISRNTNSRRREYVEEILTLASNFAR